MLGLMISISAYAGVTDGDVTAYRNAALTGTVMFTDIPAQSPNSISAPLGAGTYDEFSGCNPNVAGTAGVTGLICSGTDGDPISTYTCEFAPGGTGGSPNWCLFSENPRTGNKAWAIRFFNGTIPTNDGTSIVRCEGTDIFNPEYGCRPPASEISINGGFIKLDTTDGNAPLDAYCSETAHNGRMVVDDVDNKLYICTATGWKNTALSPP